MCENKKKLMLAFEFITPSNPRENVMSESACFFFLLCLAILASTIKTRNLNLLLIFFIFISILILIIRLKQFKFSLIAKLKQQQQQHLLLKSYKFIYISYSTFFNCLYLLLILLLFFFNEFEGVSSYNYQAIKQLS